jgi:hypothetical protein
MHLSNGLIVAVARETRFPLLCRTLGRSSGRMHVADSERMLKLEAGIVCSQPFL